MESRGEVDPEIAKASEILPNLSNRDLFVAGRRTKVFYLEDLTHWQCALYECKHGAKLIVHDLEWSV